MLIYLLLLTLKEMMMKKDMRRPKSSQNFRNKEVVEIIVTFAKSPTEFYGVDRRMLNDIQKLEDELDAWYSNKLQCVEFPCIPEIETICAALVRNHWYRVKVMYHENDGCGVYLIDSGETVQLKLPSLCWLDDHFFLVSPGVSRFTLLKSALNERFLRSSNRNVSNKFEDIAEEKTVFVKIYHSFGSFPTNYAITLSAEIPDRSGMRDEPKNIIVNVGNLESSLAKAPKRIVKMSLCISPNEFYLQFETEREKLMRLQNELQTLNALAPHRSSTRWTVGKKCYVRIKMATTLRECWYRGEILELTDGIWKVVLRDYGNVVSVRKSEDLATECEKFETLEDAAFKCSLAFIAPITGSEWSTTSIDKFSDLCQNYAQLAVTLPHRKTRSIILWGLESVNVSALKPTICEWTNINEEMVQQGLAQFTEKMSAIEANVENKVVLMDDVVCPKLTSWIASKPITIISFACVPTYVSDELVIYFHDAAEEKMLKSMRETTIEKFRKHKSNKELQWNEDEKQWRKDDVCMAKYTDGTYYRAMILTITDKIAQVI